MSPADAAKFDNIPVNALMTGNFSNPKISTDMKTVLTNLTKELAKQQSDKLLKKGSSALYKYLNTEAKLGTDTTKTATQKEDIKKKALVKLLEKGDTFTVSRLQ